MQQSVQKRKTAFLSFALFSHFAVWSCFRRQSVLHPFLLHKPTFSSLMPPPPLNPNVFSHTEEEKIPFAMRDRGGGGSRSGVNKIPRPPTALPLSRQMAGKEVYPALFCRCHVPHAGISGRNKGIARNWNK